jgi:CheY-like chemotaxis protein
MENHSSIPCIILMADDDQEDCLLARIAFEESAMEGEIRFVEDGKELMEYLRNESPRPDLILLDLNMPRMDGRSALREIKSNQNLKDIPVVILTTSRQEKDVKFCLDAGACEFKTKPVEISEWVDVIKSAKSHCPA